VKVILQTELLRSDSRLGSLIILSGAVHTNGESLQKWTWKCAELWNNLGFSLCAVPSVCCMAAISENRKKSKIEVSTGLVYHC